ncbi:MAG: hypothetical protein JST12_18735 [Armatimonadetes bacterium]|nr:hypothetical protein [Armatimonadota bacterium]
MLLGYVVGAVGIYTLLYKFAPTVAEDRAFAYRDHDRLEAAEIIELFPTREQRNAA